MKNTLLIVALMAILPVIGFAQTNDVLTLAVKKSEQEQVLLAGYGKSLNSMMAALKKNGDIDKYVIVEQQKKFFETTKKVPAPSEINKMFKALSEEYYRARVILLNQYISALDNKIKADMKADRVDSAKDAKADKDKAMAELVGIDSTSPKEAAKTNDVKKVSIVGKWGWGAGDISTLEFTTDGRVIARDVKTNKIRKGESGKWAYLNEAKTTIRRTENDGAVMLIDYDWNKPDIFTQNSSGRISNSYRINK